MAEDDQNFLKTLLGKKIHITDVFPDSPKSEKRPNDGRTDPHITAQYYKNIIGAMSSRSNSSRQNKGKTGRGITNTRLGEELAKHADSNKTIMLSIADFGYLEFAMNFYYSSLLKFHIKNYIIVSVDNETYEYLKKKNINTFMYYNLTTSSSPSKSDYGSKDFKRKTHMKTRIILDALLLGYNVLIVDVDIVFFKNPLPYLDCESCDLQIQDNLFATHEGNSGFYLVRPTVPGILLHQRAWDTAMVSPDALPNQKVLFKIYMGMLNESQISVKTLSVEQFPNGKVFWDETGRMFAGDGPSIDGAVIVHNNWILGKEAKIYRFKENLMWHYNDNNYYSDKNRRYITYSNPIDFGSNETDKMEFEALKFALYLARLLNRTLILPDFHCYNSNLEVNKSRDDRCALSAFWHITSLRKYLDFREHVFLQNNLVPDDIITSRSPHYTINTSALQLKETQYFLHSQTTKSTLLQPYSIQSGPTELELLHWFSTMDYSVLQFQFLYVLDLKCFRGQPIYKTMQFGSKTFKRATIAQKIKK